MGKHFLYLLQIYHQLLRDKRRNFYFTRKSEKMDHEKIFLHTLSSCSCRSRSVTPSAIENSSTSLLDEEGDSSSTCLVDPVRLLQPHLEHRFTRGQQVEDNCFKNTRTREMFAILNSLPGWHSR